MARLLLAASASAACCLLAFASFSGHPIADEQGCDDDVLAGRISLSLLQTDLMMHGVGFHTEEQDSKVKKQLPITPSKLQATASYTISTLACKLQRAKESLKSYGHAWPAGVVALLVALAPGTFMVSLLLTVMFLRRQQNLKSGLAALRSDAPKGNETTGKDSALAEIDHVDRSSSTEAAQYLHPMAGAALIAAWNTTSTMINFPFIFGVLGLLGGICFTVLIQGAACLATLHMVDLTAHFNAGRRKQDRVVDFPGLGACLGGKAWGDVFAFIQMLNQLGFLPYAITLMVSSTQALFPHVEFLQCNLNTCLIMVAFGYAIVQLSRDWKDAEKLSYLVLILLSIMAVVMVCFAFGNHWHYGAPTPFFLGADYQLFPDCIGACVPADKHQQYSLLNVINAIGAIMFSYAPCFIIVEMMSEMEQPEKDAKAATTIAFAYSSVLYCVIGLVFAMLWGNQIPIGVHSLLPKGSWQSIFINLVIIFAMVLDLFIGIIVVNRYIIAKFRPDFDYKWTAQNAWDWARITFAPSTAVFVMTLLIPNLVAVIGFVDCFCVPWCQYIMPVMFTVLPALRTCLEQSKAEKSKDSSDDTATMDSSDDTATMELPQISPGLGAVFVASCVFGICWSGMEFYKFVHGLADLDFGAGYFCNEVASLA